MTRTAFIGASGPIGYDYKNNTDRLHKDDHSSPNPVLEDALGLLVYYDRLVFLSRHLCPENMRELDYVSFLTDDDDLLDRTSVAIHQFEEHGRDHARNLLDANNNPTLQEEAHDRFWKRWQATTKQITNSGTEPSDRFGIDNHTHRIHIGNNTSFSANAANLESILIDWWITLACDEEWDIVYNGPASTYLDTITGVGLGLEQHMAKPSPVDATQAIIAQHMPSYQSERGPYHESIEELRNHDFVESFRRKMSGVVAMDSELEAEVKELERLAHKYRNDVFSKHMRRFTLSDTIWTIERDLLTDWAIPGGGSVLKTIAEALHAKRLRRNLGWAGFIVDLPEMTSQSNNGL